MRRSRWAVAAAAVPLLTALAGCAAAGASGPVSATSDLPALSQPSLSAAVRAGASAPQPTYTVTPLPPVMSGPPAPPPCTVFPADNIWHAPVSSLPVDAHSAAWVASIGASSDVHPDFGSGTYDGAPFGMPITRVSSTQAKVCVRFTYASESDKGPYPIPSNALIEGGSASTGDRHVILLDSTGCKAYELYDARRSGSTWTAGSGAIFNLRSDALRPAGWTSADAAGLSVLAGLVQYRRGGRRADRPRDPDDGAEQPVGVHLAGSARGRQRQQLQPAADGRAVPAQGQRRHLAPADRRLGSWPRP